MRTQELETTPIPNELRICSNCGQLAAGVCGPCALWEERTAIDRRAVEYVAELRARRRRKVEERNAREFWRGVGLWLAVAIAWLTCSLIAVACWAAIRAGLRWWMGA